MTGNLGEVSSMRKVGSASDAVEGTVIPASHLACRRSLESQICVTSRYELNLSERGVLL